VPKLTGVVAAIVAALAFGLPAAASAAGVWSTESTLGGGGATDVAMGARGDVALAWVGSLSGKLSAQIATRPPSGSFSTPHLLSPAGGEARAPLVAEDAVGEAVAVWPASVGGSNLILEASTVVDGVPSTPVKLSAPGQNAFEPAVAVDERGDAIVAWARNNGTNDIVQASFRPAGGSFGAPVSLSAEGSNAMSPKVAIDAAGDATVVWERYGTETVVEEAARPAATGVFSKPAALASSTGNPIEPAVAMDAAGDTTVAWVQIGAGKKIQVAMRPAGGKFGEPVSLTGEALDANQPQVALDGKGDPTVVWTGDFVIEYASGTRAGVFSPPKGLAFEAWYPSVAEDSAGDTVVGYATIEALAAGAAFRPAGGVFGPDQEVSSAGQIVGGGPGALNVAISADGDGAFGFSAQEPSGEALSRVSLLDTTGVALGGVSIPSTATAGVPVSFSVEPLDTVFPEPTVTWAFGDAQTASGDSVTHVFADPGTYSVTVTATAVPGDSTTQSGTIVVSAPTAPAAPATPALHAATLGSATAVADRHGRVPLRVVCPAGGAACPGTVALALPASASGLAVAARASAIPVTVAAGRAAFSAAPGAGATVEVALPAVVVKLLQRHHRLTLRATLETRGGPGQLATAEAQVVVKAPTKPGKPRRARGRR
jgi:PKD repeat protein